MRSGEVGSSRLWAQARFGRPRHSRDRDACRDRDQQKQMMVPHLATQSAGAAHLVQRPLRATQRNQPEGAKLETGECNTLGQSSSRTCGKLSEKRMVPCNQTSSALEYPGLVPPLPLLRKETDFAVGGLLLSFHLRDVAPRVSAPTANTVHVMYHSHSPIEDADLSDEKRGFDRVR